ncbi:MAG TPA: D-lyxose/D-mannose family sugar isomerase [Casimicrobiaceae bacterium]
MKRSQINAAIANAHEALKAHGIRLPEYGYWPAARWRTAGPEMRRVTRNALGWAVTDFGQGDFDNVGITMFDVRNGTPEFPDEGTPYAEKVFVLKPGQRLPFHFHWKKAEDIINRAGGTLMIQLYNARDDETMDETSPGIVYCDGVAQPFVAGQIFEVPQGGSLTITPRLYHRFWAEESAGVLVGGEISTISVPRTDNRFGENARRFVPIDEDVEPTFLMNIDYPALHEAH